MKWIPKDVMLALLGLIATAGVTAAGVSLYRALAAVRVLVSVGTVGTRALSGIQYEAQEKRRTVLQVLAAENSTERRALSAEARRTDARIATHFQELTGPRPFRRQPGESCHIAQRLAILHGLREKRDLSGLGREVLRKRALWK